MQMNTDSIHIRLLFVKKDEMAEQASFFGERKPLLSMCLACKGDPG
jgi:hypothetical protein